MRVSLKLSMLKSSTFVFIQCFKDKRHINKMQKKNSFPFKDHYIYTIFLQIEMNVSHLTFNLEWEIQGLNISGE